MWTKNESAVGLDPTCPGYVTEPTTFAYDGRTLATYALGIGAKRDELPYLYEGADGRGPQAYPTFAVVPSYPAVHACLRRTGGDLAAMVHSSQSIHVPAPPPPTGVLQTKATILGLYDLKKFALLVVGTRSEDASGTLVFETESTFLFLGQGGFGGERRPKSESSAVSNVPKDVEPSFRIDEPTSPEQALLYRLSGDTNPLHVDPAVAAALGFAQGPILHGLASYGFAARAIIRAVYAGDAAKLRRLTIEFRRPVWPGDTLTTEGWIGQEGQGALRTTVDGRPDPVMIGSWHGGP